MQDTILTRVSRRPSGVIVLADRDPIARFTCAHILEEEGHRVHQARCGNHALELCKTVKPDLIIVCVEVPVNKANRQPLIDVVDQTCTGLPILALDISDSKSKMRSISPTRAVRRLRKSFDAVEIVDAVNNVLESSTNDRRPDSLDSESCPITSSIGAT